MEALICLGPLHGKQQTFVLFEEWIGKSPPLTREESLARITKQYYTGHGPATLQDFMWWTGLTAVDAKLGLELVKSELVQRTFHDRSYWLSQEVADSPHPAEGAHLLPGFDEYLLGYRDRSAILAPQYSDRVCPGGNGIFAPMIVIDGQIVGTWKRTIKKTQVTIELQPFTTLAAAARAALRPVADRFAAFWGLTAKLA